MRAFEKLPEECPSRLVSDKVPVRVQLASDLRRLMEALAGCFTQSVLERSGDGVRAGVEPGSDQVPVVVRGLGSAHDVAG